MSDNDAVLQKLIEALGSNNPRIFESAVELLCDLGPGIVPDLLDALSDCDRAVTIGILAVLAELGPDAGDAIPAVAPLTRSPDEEIAEAARVALARMRGRSTGIAA